MTKTSFDIFITSVISLTLIRRAFSTIWWTLAMFSSVVAVFGCPERSSSPKLLRPRLNSPAQYFTVVNDGAESPYTESNSSSICVGVLSFKNKYLMTDRYSILSPTHSNITTVRPKWLKFWWVTFDRWITKFTSFYLRILLSSCWGPKLFRPPSYSIHHQYHSAEFSCLTISHQHKISRNMSLLLILLQKVVDVVYFRCRFFKTLDFTITNAELENEYL